MPTIAGVTEPKADTAFTLAVALLGHLVSRMESANVAPGRSFVADGATVPAEDCCDGVAWVRVALVSPSDGSGDPYVEMRNLPAGPAGHVITLEIGVLRCTPVLGEQGESPPPEDYTEAARVAAADRGAMRMAVLCDFPADIVAAQADSQVPSEWSPIDAGGCGGGFMTTRVGTTLVF